MKCDIIVPVWNQLEFTTRCVESMRKNTRYPHRLILIDNNSDEETAGYLEGLTRANKDIALIRNGENLGFIKATNQGLRLSDAPYVCLMNNDTEATPGWLTEMVSVAESSPLIGLVNPRSSQPKKCESNKRYLEANQCMGYCMLIKREVLERIGYLDEAYGVGGFDDTDFSKRAGLAGYKCVCAKKAYVYHDWHTSFKEAGNREESVRRNEEIFFNKWGRYLRIGYPITYSNGKDFSVDINTSLGLAQEWNWVHTWLNAKAPLRDDPAFLNLTEHQSLRLFNMSGVKAVFYIEVLFRLMERRFKKKKPFDVVLISDRDLMKFLSIFKGVFSFPLLYVERGSIREAGGEEFWRRRAKDIVNMVNKEKSNEL